jgi:hypothetical protein
MNPAIITAAIRTPAIPYNPVRLIPYDILSSPRHEEDELVFSSMFLNTMVQKFEQHVKNHGLKM